MIAWTEATPDVHCNEALVFAGHVTGCDRDRRLRLTSFHPLGERPRTWSEDDAFDPDDPQIGLRYHFVRRDLPLDELAASYETAIDRKAVLAGIRRWIGTERAVKGCEEGFRARSLLARHSVDFLDSTG